MTISYQHVTNVGASVRWWRGRISQVARLWRLSFVGGKTVATQEDGKVEEMTDDQKAEADAFVERLQSAEKYNEYLTFKCEGLTKSLAEAYARLSQLEREVNSLRWAYEQG